ncbi:Epsin-1, required for endocytosis and actin patch assembly, partial [Actinomortierella wolfii]
MSTPKYAAKSAARQLKNFTKGYTEWQAKVREATSNDPWGPSGTQMNELAQATYH